MAAAQPIRPVEKASESGASPLETEESQSMGPVDTTQLRGFPWRSLGDLILKRLSFWEKPRHETLRLSSTRPFFGGPASATSKSDVSIVESAFIGSPGRAGLLLTTGGEAVVQDSIFSLNAGLGLEIHAAFGGLPNLAA